MTATSGSYVRILGIDTLTGKVQTWPQRIDEAVHEQIMREVEPLVIHMKETASHFGGAARIASRTARVSSTADGMSVVTGGAGLAATLMAGAEYGGRKRPKKAYVNRSKRGKGYIVRRRTTQQFKPHLGSRGYWFWPTARKDLKGINKRVAAVIQKVVE